MLANSGTYEYALHCIDSFSVVVKCGYNVEVMN